MNGREESMATGMELGVALPHGASVRVGNVFGALGVSKEGIDFDCLDGLPARLIMLLVVPKDEFHVHVRTLAGISHLLNDQAFRERLLEAESADVILRSIRMEEKGSFFQRLRGKAK